MRPISVEQPDGKAEYIGGWAGKWTCKNPEEWTVRLPDRAKVGKGKHTLRYTIVSDGGKYKNAYNEMIPIVRGRIVSNKVSFSVK